VDVRFTRIRRPTDHAKIERMHQTMTLQALLGQHWADPQRLWAGLDARRERLNQHIPSRMLGGQTPLQAYPEASDSGRHYRPEWEAELLDLKRVYQYLATGRWFRPSTFDVLSTPQRTFCLAIRPLLAVGGRQ